MKTRNYLSHLSLILLMSLSFNTFAVGETEPPPNKASDQVTAQAAATEVKVDEAVQANRSNIQSFCQNQSSFQGLAASCNVCAQQAAEVCGNPEAFAEKSGINGTAKGIVEQAPAMGALASAVGGDSMAQMQCYGSAIGALGGMFASKAVSKICKEWRDGFEGGGMGCKSLCGNAGKAYPEAIKAANGDPATIQALSKQYAEVKKANQACLGKTTKGEQSTLAQSMQMAQQMMQAKACMDGVGDDSFAGDELEEVDCSLPQYAGRSECLTIDNKAGIGSGGLDTTLADLAGSSDLDGDNDQFTPPNDAVGPTGQQAKAGSFGNGGSSGAGGGGLPPAGNAAPEAGKKGAYAAKAKDLVGGYRSSASTGGGSKRRGKKFNLNKFKLDKDKKKKADTDALNALAAFAKAGIAPYSEGFIFERITNRFSATCNPKQFYDCTRNQISWYEQNKFKKK